MYIKVKIQDVLDGSVPSTIGADLARILRKHGLSIYAYDKFGDKLQYTDIGEYRYLLVKAFDITRQVGDVLSKGRLTVPAQAEIDDINQYIFINGFETVDSLPVQEII